MLNQSEADWFHLDVMDGVFVPNISFGFGIIEKIRKATSKTLDVHLMIVEPERYIERFKKAGADIISIHIEACRNPVETLRAIRSLNAKAGIVINPGTPVSMLSTLRKGLYMYSRTMQYHSKLITFTSQLQSLHF